MLIYVRYTYLVFSLFVTFTSYSQLNQKAKFFKDFGSESTDKIYNSFIERFESNCGLNESYESNRSRIKFINENSDCLSALADWAFDLDENDEDLWGKQRAFVLALESSAVNWREINNFLEETDFNKKLPDGLILELISDFDYKSHWCYVYFELRYHIAGQVDYNKT